ncbi:MAG: hypothetical protein IJ189_00835 [Clostridia bacterium]|nr:hypothetical protein [Clostridia bacterium]
MTVTFCGHSEITEEAAVQAWLHETVFRLCLQGAKRFLIGGYGCFDGLAAKTVWRVKSLFPEVSSVLVLPYLNRDVDMALYDHSLYPPLENVPRRYAIVKRNEWMVTEADVVVAYVLHSWGGASRTYEYAARKGKTIISFEDRKKRNDR